MNQQTMFKLFKGISKVVKYAYLGFVVLLVVLLAREELKNIGMLGVILQKSVIAIEMVSMIVLLGLKVSIKIFEGIKGDILGTQSHYMVTFWRNTEVAVKDILVYNGFVGVVLLASL